ncbi:hypothetical protein FGU65_01740 [Methanoculleus sp. FWC-SCC1]|uniref:Peptidase C-terminal archaeal/bacterial domain-containing protein n=1 Tax=Methanoculleus frigidifontis TaxID=2584085 RepID=A0ABT8M6S0_9EURY|nr:hypothetical protein [Methanoculleus sp. FWC-SCC1]MDN7023632.1 hypothetical protein [Methanoculleus sp. FWC-SCC1]
MKYAFFILLLIAAVILTCGCTQQSAVSPTEPTPTPTAAGQPADAALARLSDSSPNLALSLDAGVLLLSFHTDGAQKMDIGFTDASNVYGAGYDFSTTGPFNGSLVLPVPQKEDYLLNVSGTGAWTASVSRFEPDAVLRAPLNLSGDGTEVPPAFYLEEGQYIFERNETGVSSPLYELLYANGSYVMDANNTYVEPRFPEFSPETFRIVTIPQSGEYILSVLARDNPSNWTVSILPAPTLPPLGPGPEIPEKGE